MDGSSWLQIFLLANVFIMGLVTAIAARHALAHFNPHTHDAEKSHPSSHQPTVQLPPEVKARLLEKSELQFQKILTHSADELSHSLQITTANLNKQLEKVGDDIITTEMKRYHDALEKLRAQTEDAINGAYGDVSKHKQELIEKLDQKQLELEGQLTEKIKVEQQTLIKNIDDKLADAVTSFLNETLKHNIDLGAQSTYLIDMLEEHKSELKKGLVDEA